MLSLCNYSEFHHFELWFSLWGLEVVLGFALETGRDWVGQFKVVKPIRRRD